MQAHSHAFIVFFPCNCHVIFFFFLVDSDLVDIVDLLNVKAAQCSLDGLVSSYLSSHAIPC